MAAIRASNTRPEMIVRRGLHGRGFRFRLHERSLPGRPDLVLRKHRAVVFVNGCFWHGHDCALFVWPRTREEFWRSKINGNVARDAANLAALSAAGWRVCVVWECALKGRGRLDPRTVIDTVAAWLLSDAATLALERRR